MPRQKSPGGSSGGRGNRDGSTGAGKGTGRGVGQRRGMGPAGEGCLCPNCGEHIPHQRGVPCFTTKCPKCGSSMMRVI